MGWGYPAKEINEQGKTPNPDEAPNDPTKGEWVLRIQPVTIIPNITQTTKIT